MALDRGRQRRDESAHGGLVVGERDHGHEHIAIGHLERHAFGEQVFFDGVPVRAGAGQENDELCGVDGEAPLRVTDGTIGEHLDSFYGGEL